MSDASDRSPPIPPALPARPAISPDDERLYATLIHLSGLAWILGIPGLFGVLVFWLLRRERSSFVDRHGKAALNFQISLLIYGTIVVAAYIMGIVLMIFVIGFLFFIPCFLAMLGLMILQLITAIQGSVQANRGEEYEYPLSLTFVR